MNRRDFLRKCAMALLALEAKPLIFDMGKNLSRVTPTPGQLQIANLILDSKLPPDKLFVLSDANKIFKEKFRGVGLELYQDTWTREYQCDWIPRS